MSHEEPLPRLRTDIDVMPSPIKDQPGLLLRDPFRFTEDVLVVPPVWIAVLSCLDGAHSARDAQELMSRRLGGEIVPQRAVREFVDALSQSGFMEDQALTERRARAEASFKSAPVREAGHAGAAYPDQPEALTREFSGALGDTDPGVKWPVAIAAPHVSPGGGYASYRASYDLPPVDEMKTFVVLGTSHYGEPERFGTTSKSFQTPLGTVPVDIEALEVFTEHAGEAAIEEDYCHRVEHSIEFQVVCLKFRLAQPFRILPILCGPFADSLATGRAPETVDTNRRAFDALSELAARREDLVWVLGVDMAHVGVRYGDREPAHAYQGRMEEVQERDTQRLQRICDADAHGFFELTHPGGDPLKWCGYAPFYTFLYAVAERARLRGEVLSYEQWNIDERSVVSFGAVHFRPLGESSAPRPS